jgi:hypothetical protein
MWGSKSLALILRSDTSSTPKFRFWDFFAKVALKRRRVATVRVIKQKAPDYFRLQRLSSILSFSELGFAPRGDGIGDFGAAVAHEGADVAGFSVGEGVGRRPSGKSAGSGGRNVGVIIADHNEDGASWFFGFDAEADGVEDGSGFVAPLRVRPLDSGFVAIGKGGAGVFDGAVFPFDNGWIGFGFAGGADAFGGHGVDKDDEVGVDGFGGFEDEDSAHTGSDENEGLFVFDLGGDLGEIVGEGGFGVVIFVWEKVGGDDVESGFFEGLFPVVVFPASATGAVDHDGGRFFHWGGGCEGDEEGEHGLLYLGYFP